MPSTQLCGNVCGNVAHRHALRFAVGAACVFHIAFLQAAVADDDAVRNAQQFAVRQQHAGALVAGATAAGPGTNARAADKADVAGSLELGAGDVVLVKASRVLALEDVTAQLIDRDEEGTAR